jgi:hypothetical protein
MDVGRHGARLHKQSLKVTNGGAAFVVAPKKQVAGFHVGSDVSVIRHGQGKKVKTKGISDSVCQSLTSMPGFGRQR